jgi:hypothetical protein
MLALSGTTAKSFLSPSVCSKRMYVCALLTILGFVP